MKLIIIKLLITYLVIATFILFNLLFNPRIEWKLINKITKQTRNVPPTYTVLFCIYWIITIPFFILKGGENNES